MHSLRLRESAEVGWNLFRAVLQPVFVEDVASACIQAALSDCVDGEIINIGTGIATSNEDLVRIIEDSLHKKINVAVGAYAPHKTDTTAWSADITKAKKLLNWQPRYTLQE